MARASTFYIHVQDCEPVQQMLLAAFDLADAVADADPGLVPQDISEKALYLDELREHWSTQASEWQRTA